MWEPGGIVSWRASSASRRRYGCSNLDGSPADVTTDSDTRAPYAVLPPEILRDPNPIDAIVKAEHAGSPIETWLSSYAAHIDGMDDVATVLVDPLVASPNAAGAALQEAALYAQRDSASPNEIRARAEKELETRALKADPGLWYPQAWLILDEGEQKGLVDAVEPLQQLAAKFTEPARRSTSSWRRRTRAARVAGRADARARRSRRRAFPTT